MVSHDNQNRRIEVARGWRHTSRHEVERVQTSEEHITDAHSGKALPIVLQQRFPSIAISLWAGTCRLRLGLPLWVWPWGSESRLHYKHIKCLSQIDSRSDLMGFCLVLFDHLCAENQPEALCLPWQNVGLGCGSTWKQACVATKGIVIMNTFEDPAVSNVPLLREGRAPPTSAQPPFREWSPRRGCNLGAGDTHTGIFWVAAPWKWSFVWNHSPGRITRGQESCNNGLINRICTEVHRSRVFLPARSHLAPCF